MDFVHPQYIYIYSAINLRGLSKPVACVFTVAIRTPQKKIRAKRKKQSPGTGYLALWVVNGGEHKPIMWLRYSKKYHRIDEFRKFSIIFTISECLYVGTPNMVDKKG